MRVGTADNTRDKLVQAAAALVEEGATRIDMRAVARRAGVTHNAPYRHFDDRAALVAAVAETAFGELHDRCRRAQAAHADDPLRRWSALGVTYLSFAIERPGIFRVMFGPEAGRPAVHVRTAEASVFAMCVDAIASAQRAGLVVDGDPQELAMVCWATMHGLATLMLDGLADWVGMDQDVEALGAAFTRHVYRGLEKRSG